MSDLVGLFNLLAPFFGLILLGFVSAKRARLPESGLAWMQFFLVYLALPALFYRLTSAQPIDEFANGRFVAVTAFATASAFTLSFVASLWRKRRLRPHSGERHEGRGRREQEDRVEHEDQRDRRGRFRAQEREHERRAHIADIRI